MPKIYDNREVSFLSGLSAALDRSYRSDICTAYFNLRGWKKIAGFIEKYKGEENSQCRLLLGMYAPDRQFKQELLRDEAAIWSADNKKARRLRAEALKKFRDQLMTGAPFNEDEKNLRKLARQLKEKKVVVKCFTRHPLHAKLYLTFNKKEFGGKSGFVGSSNLTYAGLEKNGELNIDILDQKALSDLNEWFEDKWQDQFSLDISEEIIRLIEESWAGERLLPPYHIYMKMAWHLSEDARKGLTDFFIPKELKKVLFDFQSSAVRISARYVYYKKGVLIGDVVGLGKTLMAIATAKILEEEHGFQSLVLCPKNLQDMWEDQKQKYGLRGTVIPVSQAQQKLPSLRRHHIVIIDESHNLRNPLGKRYQAVKDYIAQNDSRCILLSATPYNKTYKDLAGQLGLFIDPDEDLGIRPVKFLNENAGNFEGSASTLQAFEQSLYPEDWRQLMARFLVRRTRSFIKENYAKKDENGKFYIETSEGGKKFFPDRIAKTIRYEVDEQYRRFFSKEVVDMINSLKLARYDLISYKKKNLGNLIPEKQNLFKDLERSHGYPKGFCRINLFKRLESSGFSFLRSVQRHILRNCVFIYAIDTNQDLVIGEKSGEVIADIFDDKEGGITGFQEETEETEVADSQERDEETGLNNSQERDGAADWRFRTDFESFYKKAEEIYNTYKQQTRRRSLRWISSSYFTDRLKEDLRKDTDQFISLLKKSKNWNPDKDLKLKKLESLLKERAEKKVLIFTQSRETAGYLKDQLKVRGIKNLGLITGGMEGVQKIIKRFSPESNEFDIYRSDLKFHSSDHLSACRHGSLGLPGAKNGLGHAPAKKPENLVPVKTGIKQLGKNPSLEDSRARGEGGNISQSNEFDTPIPPEFSGSDRREKAGIFKQNQKYNINPSKESEIDVLITTDVLSEGQNLQDCNTVINYDLPWAVIKLIQRVGRVDRIGQKADKIICRSFMPDEGLEQLINLRDRISRRLKENAELIGTDERFFENDREILWDLYNERSEALEREISDDIDLSSFALEIWNKGVKKDPSLEEKITNMPDVVHSSKPLQRKGQKEGVLLFAKSHVHNWLLYLDRDGRNLQEDQMGILKLAECAPNAKPLKRAEKHYEAVRSGLNIIQENLNRPGPAGRLGGGRSPRRKLFEKLDKLSATDEEMKQIMDDIYHYPLSNEAEHTLKRIFRRKMPDGEVFYLVREKYRNETLVNKKEAKRMDEPPRIICSMGIIRRE